MSSFLVATYPSPGHVAPAAVVVRELVGRGHDVRWYTSTRFAETVAEAGASLCPMPRTSTGIPKTSTPSFLGELSSKG